MPFDSFIGNSKALACVREMAKAGRVPGSLLFAGPEGIGKKTLARMLAKALVCERDGNDFCDECARCRKAEQMFTLAEEDLLRRRDIKEAARRVEGLVYFDFQIIAPLTRFILTDQIRQLRQVAYTRPFEFPRRVFIVDNAQTIHWQAADLLLKVLEEPPDTTSFILICSYPYELRPTIRSRCLQILFQPVAEPAIRELLARQGGFSNAQLALAARVAAGSVAKAKNFDLAAYELRRKPWLEFLAAVSRRPASSSAGMDWRPLLDSAKALAERRDDFEATLDIGYSLLRDLLLVLLHGPENEVTNIDILPRLQAWAAGLGMKGIELLKSGLDQAYRLQVRNVNQQLGFETLGLEVSAGVR
ncbi:MAG: AAA family ATPase [Terriglobia bacterium]|jgi:DNA polymerase-3 subunit delta'